MPARAIGRPGAAWAAAAFLFAVVTPAAAAPDGAAAPGGLVRVKEIRVFGNALTSRRVVLHYCEFYEGQVLTQADLDRRLARSERNLRNTLFFARVRLFDLPRSDPAQAVIMVDVAEGTTWHLSASTRQVKLSKENIGGEGFTLGVEGGLDRQRLFYYQPWVFDLPLEFSAAPFYENGHLTSVENDRGEAGEWFYSEALGAEAAAGYIVTLRSTAGLGFLAERLTYYNRVFKADAWKRFGVAPRAALGALRPYARWDGRDSDLYPTKGLYVGVEAEISPRGVGDYAYEAVQGDVRAYVPPGGGFVLATRARLGTSSASTPYSRRFSIHGGEGLRTVNSYKTVGTRMTLFTAEVRRRLFPSPVFDAWFEGVWFVDAGRTWDPGQPYRWEGFDYATGPSLRLHMKSPLYFDWRADLNLKGDVALYATARRGF